MEQTFYIKANSVAFTGHRSVPESKKDELKKKMAALKIKATVS